VLLLKSRRERAWRGKSCVGIKKREMIFLWKEERSKYHNSRRGGASLSQGKPPIISLTRAWGHPGSAARAHLTCPAPRDHDAVMAMEWRGRVVVPVQTGHLPISSLGDGPGQRSRNSGACGWDGHRSFLGSCKSPN
jgi:hypothetical protein